MNKTHVIEHLRFALEAQLTTAKVAAKLRTTPPHMKKT